MIRMTGAEFLAFYKDEAFWGPQRKTRHSPWHDDAVITVNGQDASDLDVDLEAVRPTDTVTLDLGIVRCDAWPDVTYTLDRYARRWRNVQDARYLLIKCPESTVALIEDAVSKLGGRIEVAS